MKILKKANQKNVIVNKDYYTPNELNDLLYNEDICYFDDKFNEKYDRLEDWEIDNITFRIFTETVERLEVVLDDYGYYTTVAYTKKGFKIYINL